MPIHQSEHFGGDAGDICHQTVENSPSNAYVHGNVAAIREHHEKGIVPPQYRDIAAEKLGICPTQVGVAPLPATA